MLRLAFGKKPYQSRRKNISPFWWQYQTARLFTLLRLIKSTGLHAAFKQSEIFRTMRTLLLLLLVVAILGNSRRCKISFCIGLTNTSPVPTLLHVCVCKAVYCRRFNSNGSTTAAYTPPPPPLSVIQPCQNLPNALHTSAVSSHILLYLCLRARVVNFPLLFALHRTIMAVVKTTPHLKTRELPSTMRSRLTGLKILYNNDE